MTTAPALYVGTLRHRRHRPAAHEFRYSLFMVMLDVDRIAEAVGLIRENMKIARFTRYVLGEGLEKKQTDFAAEVAAAAGQ